MVSVCMMLAFTAAHCACVNATVYAYVSQATLNQLCVCVSQNVCVCLCVRAGSVHMGTWACSHVRSPI